MNEVFYQFTVHSGACSADRNVIKYNLEASSATCWVDCNENGV